MGHKGAMDAGLLKRRLEHSSHSSAGLVMRDWIIVLAPTIFMLYFVTHPVESGYLMTWLTQRFP